MCYLVAVLNGYLGELVELGGSVSLDLGVTLDDEVHGAPERLRGLSVVREQRVRGLGRTEGSLRSCGGGRNGSCGWGGGGGHFVLQDDLQERRRERMLSAGTDVYYRSQNLWTFHLSQQTTFAKIYQITRVSPFNLKDSRPDIIVRPLSSAT